VQDVSYIISLVSILVLLVSAAAGWSVFHRPQLQPVIGRLQQDNRENRAAIALLVAFGLSLAAAILAVSAWMF
jgi:hypothetical protein